MSKKKLLSLALIVIMIAILSFSSLAWFTDDDSATNKFTIAGVDPEKPNDPDKIFSVDVKEIVDDEETPVDDMDFKDILPGDEYKKEAYITNTGSYDQYIRVTMTITDWKQIEKIVTINMDDAVKTKWKITSLGVDTDDAFNLITKNYNSVGSDGSLTVVMYLNQVLKVGDKVDLMDLVSVSVKATQEDFAKEEFVDGFQISIKADAVQTKNILESYGTVEWQNAENSFKALEANP